MSYANNKTIYPLLTINGMIPSNSTSDSVNDIVFSSGYCSDDNYSNLITASNIVKQIDSTFSPGSSAGMLINSTEKSNSAVYYTYSIGKSNDKNAFDYIASTSLLTSSTQLPIGWDIKRFNSIFQTSSTGAILQGKWWRIGNLIHFRYNRPYQDFPIGFVSAGDTRKLLTTIAPTNTYGDFVFIAFNGDSFGSYLTWGATHEDDIDPGASPYIYKMNLASDYGISITAVDNVYVDDNRHIFYRGQNSSSIVLQILCTGYYV